jgi:tellurite resistance protein
MTEAITVETSQATSKLWIGVQIDNITQTIFGQELTVTDGSELVYDFATGELITREMKPAFPAEWMLLALLAVAAADGGKRKR